MKNIIHTLFVFFLIVIFLGCSTKKQNESIKIAALIRNNNETFLVSYIGHLKAAAKKRDVDLQIFICNDDSAIQLDQLKTCLSQGIRHFVFIPVNTAMTPQLTKLIEFYDGAAAFSNVIPSVAALKVGKNSFYASSPETAAGTFQAQILHSYFSKYPEKCPGKVLNIFYLDGEYGHPAQVFRRAGVFSALEKLGYKVNVIAEDTAGWTLPTSRQLVNNWIAKYGKNSFNAIIAQNDDMGLGAIEALIENKMVDDLKDFSKDIDSDGISVKIPVVGVDGTAAAKKSMQENKLLGTVLQDASLQAETAVDLVYTFAKRGSLSDYTTEKGISAATEVTKEDPVSDRAVLSQCFVVPFVPVTK